MYAREERLNLEFEIRRLAGLLKHLLIEADGMKTQRRIIAGEKLGSSGNSAGPSSPGNGEAISLHAEIIRELKRWARTFDIDPTLAKDPCDRIALRAFYIAEHHDAELFTEELRAWIRKSEHLTGRGPSITDLANRPEQRQTAKSICWRLNNMGHHATPDLIRKWAERGKITRTKNKNNDWTYLLTECIQQLSSNVL
ncbi:Uncharacterised protein [Corynebacterium ulcerans]|nr:Uncharacterised protein [Corynebacterium ulcerans]